MAPTSREQVCLKGRWVTRLLTSSNKTLVAASASCPLLPCLSQNDRVTSYPVLPSQSCVRCSMSSPPEGCPPEAIACGTAAVPASVALKRPSFSSPHNVPWPSRRSCCSHCPSRSLLSLSLRFLLFIGWCRSRTTNQFQSLSQ